MSECVVQMEMPKNCQRCELFAICTGKCKNEVVRFDGQNIDKKDRRCLFVCQLPEGHGRLVDGDKLMGEMKNRKWMIGRASDPDCLVFDAPTIVPAEAERSET